MLRAKGRNGHLSKVQQAPLIFKILQAWQESHCCNGWEDRKCFQLVKSSFNLPLDHFCKSEE
jgi:hypothetical protein